MIRGICNRKNLLNQLDMVVLVFGRFDLELHAGSDLNFNFIVDIIKLVIKGVTYLSGNMIDT